jgi:hypothetical protein
LRGNGTPIENFRYRRSGSKSKAAQGVGAPKDNPNFVSVFFISLWGGADVGAPNDNPGSVSDEDGAAGCRLQVASNENPPALGLAPST